MKIISKAEEYLNARPGTKISSLIVRLLVGNLNNSIQRVLGFAYRVYKAGREGQISEFCGGVLPAYL